MGVIVRPSGPLKEYTAGQPSVEMSAGYTVRELLVQLGIPVEVVALVLVNNEPQNKGYMPVDGDTVQVLAVIGGG